MTFARTTTYVSDPGSSHKVTPVKPEWPKLPMGKSIPRGLDNSVSMSQPKPRRFCPAMAG
ncbi:Uncharacterised protein [Mycobacteroides abscessus]|nr:Uncharacterised protein [Mycobacteroides abscessus]